MHPEEPSEAADPEESAAPIRPRRRRRRRTTDPAAEAKAEEPVTRDPETEDEDEDKEVAGSPKSEEGVSAVRPRRRRGPRKATRRRGGRAAEADAAPSSKTCEPDAAEADAADPGAGDPGAGDPEAGDLEAGDLEAGDPEAGDPEIGDPEIGDPEAGERLDEEELVAQAPDEAAGDKVLLVNAADRQEVRIVLLEDERVEELYVEAAEERLAAGSIYRGRVQNVEKGIGAAFVDLGHTTTGFLHVSDLADRTPGATIADLLSPGDEVVVQITRESVGRKGPALSGRIALPGRHLVLLANTPRSGVSRRIARGRTRDRARKFLSRLEVPEGMGLIVRTAGEEASLPELQRDLDHLVAEWEALQAKAAKPGPPGLLRSESDLAERSVRDIMPAGTSRIVVDREDLARRIGVLLEAWYGSAGTGGEADPDEREGGGQARGPVAPEVVVHRDPMPLFHAWNVEGQVEEAYRRVIRLPSGGSIVIDPTEALVAVDVNSGRHTGEEDPEATALQTNLEAAEEIARQLRLRDLGGQVVIDLIDLRDRAAGRSVQKALRKALARDRARIRVGRITPFGCVILSRQRIRQALSRVTHAPCESCGGTGRRRLPPGLSLRVLREMQARAARAGGRGGLEVRMPKDVLDWIQRHRRRVLTSIEGVCSGPVRLVADDRLPADGWAIKGLPPAPRGGGGAPRGKGARRKAGDRGTTS